ncbi:MAG: NAD-dependent epimerase/dehydratase family protein [Caldilineaceae bacterium]
MGSNIVHLLVNKGHTVTVLDDFSSGYHVNLDPFPQVQLIQGSICDSLVVDRAVEGVEVIFHLAASVGNTRSIQYPIEDTEINALGTLRILETARHAGVRKVIYSSSAGIFGELKTLPIREDHPIDPGSPYGASKLAGEKLCLAYSKLYDLEAVCLRYFNVYGINQRYDAYGNVIPIFAHHIFNRKPITIFGDGEQTRDFINVRDVAQANYLAAQTYGVSGAFNLGSATRVTINWLATTMVEISGMKTPIEYAPPRPGDVRDSLADISAVQQAVHFTPKVGLKEGLEEYMAWARKEMAA